jgi:hypothetical protein
MKTKDSLLLENAYELIQIKQFLLSEGYSLEEIEQAIVEQKLGGLFKRVAKGVKRNATTAAIMAGLAASVANSLPINNQNTNSTPTINTQRINDPKYIYENPVYNAAYTAITGNKYDTSDSIQNSKFWVVKELIKQKYGPGGLTAQQIMSSNVPSIINGINIKYSGPETEKLLQAYLNKMQLPKTSSNTVQPLKANPNKQIAEWDNIIKSKQIQ